MTTRIGRLIGDRARRYREQAGLTQQEVADRTEQLGNRISRGTLAKIERPDAGTRADNLSLMDFLTLAAALDVPPVMLLLPLGESELVEVIPGNPVHPHLVHKWIKGTEEFTRDGHAASFDPKQWTRNAQPVRLFDKLELLQARQELTTLQPEDPRWSEREKRVDEHLAYMRDAGLSIPKELDDGER